MRRLNQMSRQCRSKVEAIQLGSVHEKYGVWARPNKWIAISIYELNLIAGFIWNFDLLLQKRFLRSISMKWLNRDANGRFTFWWAFCLVSRSVNHCSMPSHALPTFSCKDFSEFK